MPQPELDSAGLSSSAAKPRPAPRPPGLLRPAVQAELPLVLLADDNEAHLRLMEVALLEFDCRVLCAQDGTELLGLLKQHTPDLIITDICMPGLSGIDIGGRMRGIPRLHSIPLILVTSHLTEQTKSMAAWERAFALLEKPLERRTFLHSIQDALSLRSRPPSLSLAHRTPNAVAWCLLQLQRPATNRSPAPA